MSNVFILIGFIGLQFLIGGIVSRYIKTGDDYFVAGRKQGSWIVTFSIFATWFGSESCLSTAGRVYEYGISGARSDPFGYALCLLVYGLFLARKLWSEKILTIGDVIGRRYGVATEVLAAIILAFTSLLWAGGQLRAFAHVLAAHSSINLQVAILLAASISICYTAIGGLMANAYTDLVQGIILIVGLVALAVCVFWQIPNPAQLFSQMPSERIQIFPAHTSFFANLDTWCVPLIGSLVCQELVSRVSGAKSARVATKGATLATILYLALGFIPLALGLVAPFLIGELKDSEETLIRLGEVFLPPSMHLLLSAAIISAIISTVDSTILACSALLTCNIWNRFQPLSGPKQLKIGRIFSILAGIAACFIGLSSNSVYELVHAASAFGSAGIFVLFWVGLYTPYGSAVSGICTLLVGVFSAPFYENILGLDGPYVWSLITAVVCFFSTEALVNIWKGKRFLAI